MCDDFGVKSRKLMKNNKITKTHQKQSNLRNFYTYISRDAVALDI